MAMTHTVTIAGPMRKRGPARQPQLCLLCLCSTMSLSDRGKYLLDGKQIVHRRMARQVLHLHYSMVTVYVLIAHNLVLKLRQRHNMLSLLHRLAVIMSTMFHLVDRTRWLERLVLSPKRSLSHVQR